MAKCECEKKTTRDMTFEEFQRWASEYMVEGLLEGGLKGMRTNLRNVINQQAFIFRDNGGFQKD